MSSKEFLDFNVNVDNPQKHFDPLETYISFRVTTKFKQKAKEGSEYTVRRRYNDFLWLRNKLIETFPTLVVPALPAKHSVLEQLDRYSRPFVMMRMAMLHAYLQRLASHPVFSCSPVLEIFLRAQSLSDVMKQNQTTHSILDRLSGSLHSFTNMNIKTSQFHPEFGNVKVYVDNLSKKLSSVLNIASRINKERLELSYEVKNAKRSLVHWSYQEPELADALQGIADAVDTVAQSQSVHLLQNFNAHIEQPLEEYINYIDAVKEALYRRDVIQYNYENSLSESQKKRAEKQQLEVLDGNSHRFGLKLWKVTSKDKLKKLEQELPTLDNLVEENQDKMEIANEGIKSDLERWNDEKVVEIKGILGKIADEHVLYYEESLQAWEKALEILKGSYSQDKKPH